MTYDESSDLNDLSRDADQSLRIQFVRLKTQFQNLEKLNSDCIARFEKEFDKLRNQQDLINKNIGNYDTSIEQNDNKIEVIFKELEKRVDTQLHSFGLNKLETEIQNVKNIIDKDNKHTQTLFEDFSRLADAKFSMQEKIVRFGWIATCVVIILWVAKSYIIR